jgi:hypothetical protein
MGITDNQLKGNWGEQFIASELAFQGCLIRHVTQGHDSGIDLYCESTKDGIPYLHFWCQVKTSTKWSGEESKCSFTPETKHKRYWLKQPAPVYIFLVPDARYKSPAPYFICTALDLLANDKINSFIKIKNSTDLTKFLADDLLYQTFMWDLKDGKVSHLKNPESEYTVKIPGGITHQFEGNLYNSLHSTLWRLSKDIMFEGNRPIDVLSKKHFSDCDLERHKKAKPYIEALRILVEAKNDAHYQNFLCVAYGLEFEEEYRESLEYYEKAKSIIEKDININSKEPPWCKIVETIDSHIQNVSKKIRRLVTYGGHSPPYKAEKKRPPPFARAGAVGWFRLQTSTS